MKGRQRVVREPRWKDKAAEAGEKAGSRSPGRPAWQPWGAWAPFAASALSLASSISSPSRDVFPQGLPDEYAFVTTFRLRKMSRKEDWYIWQVIDQYGIPQVSSAPCLHGPADVWLLLVGVASPRCLVQGSWSWAREMEGTCGGGTPPNGCSFLPLDGQGPGASVSGTLGPTREAAASAAVRGTCSVTSMFST